LINDIVGNETPPEAALLTPNQVECTPYLSYVYDCPGCGHKSFVDPPDKDGFCTCRECHSRVEKKNFKFNNRDVVEKIMKVSNNVVFNY
jgi:transcription elongation factor Elf1